MGEIVHVQSRETIREADLDLPKPMALVDQATKSSSSSSPEVRGGRMPTLIAMPVTWIHSHGVVTLALLIARLQVGCQTKDE